MVCTYLFVYSMTLLAKSDLVVCACFCLYNQSKMLKSQTVDVTSVCQTPKSINKVFIREVEVPQTIGNHADLSFFAAFSS